jgi:iron-sulfur cluster repair protein YtfE (RIC family)
MEALTSRITKQSRVNEIFEEHPETFQVFIRYGIPACCPLGTLEAEAKKRGINADKLLRDIHKIIGER